MSGGPKVFHKSFLFSLSTSLNRGESICAGGGSPLAGPPPPATHSCGGSARGPNYDGGLDDHEATTVPSKPRKRGPASTQARQLGHGANGEGLTREDPRATKEAVRLGPTEAP
jgi:hypothetical protein